MELETYFFFFNIPYLTILSTLEVSENIFSHQNITFYAFFSIRPPTRGSFYVKILFMITWLIMELETYFFFNIPYLTILNTLEVSENTFSHQNITNVQTNIAAF